MKKKQLKTNGCDNPEIVSEVEEGVSGAMVTKDESVVTNPTRIYGQNWIVLQNRLVHAISDLTLDERRLILLLSPIVREQVDRDPGNHTFTIRASQFASEYNLNGNSYYENLRVAATSLLGKPFFFWEFDENRKQSYNRGLAWIGGRTLRPDEAVIDIELMPGVIELLTVFDSLNPFTKYQKQLIVNLGNYGIILLELIASFLNQDNKQKTYTIEFLREKFFCNESYKSVSDFTRYVLATAIQDLSTSTPYTVRYKSNKTGRRVTSITLFVTVEKHDKIVEVVVDENRSKPKKLYKKGLSLKQIAKLAIYKNEFVGVNQHMINDTTLDTYQVFEDFKEKLASAETVNEFDFINEFLSIKQGQDIPELIAPKRSDAKRQAIKDVTPESLSKSDIQKIVNNEHFQYDYPKKGVEIGSDEHIEYLAFRLQANPTEFTKKPLRIYL